MTENKVEDEVVDEAVDDKSKGKTKAKTAVKTAEAPPFILKVKLTLIQEMLGTVPKNEDVFKAYLEHRAKGAEQKDEFKSPLTEDQISERESKSWTGFPEDEKGPFVYDYMIKGNLKNNGNILKPVTNARSKMNEHVFIFPRRIHFENGEKLSPLERPLRAQTMQGPRVSLVKSDQMSEGSTLTFYIVKPTKGELSRQMIEEVLDYGQFIGLGQWRNAGFGKYEFEVLEEIPFTMDAYKKLKSL